MKLEHRQEHARVRQTGQRRGSRGRLDWRGSVSLFGVGLLVVVISLPRLRDYAVRENELDALAFSKQLNSLLQGAPESQNLAQLLELSPQRKRLLRDAELSADGRLLRRRGYLFDLVPGSSPGPGLGAAGNEGVPVEASANIDESQSLSDMGAMRGSVVRAWPWEYGTTGSGAFLLNPERGVLGHANVASSWSGPESPPSLEVFSELFVKRGEQSWSASGWQSLGPGLKPADKKSSQRSVAQPAVFERE